MVGRRSTYNHGDKICSVPALITLPRLEHWCLQPQSLISYENEGVVDTDRLLFTSMLPLIKALYNTSKYTSLLFAFLSRDVSQLVVYICLVLSAVDLWRWIIPFREMPTNSGTIPEYPGCRLYMTTMLIDQSATYLIGGLLKRRTAHR